MLVVDSDLGADGRLKPTAVESVKITAKPLQTAARLIKVFEKHPPPTPASYLITVVFVDQGWEGLHAHID